MTQSKRKRQHVPPYLFLFIYVFLVMFIYLEMWHSSDCTPCVLPEKYSHKCWLTERIVICQCFFAGAAAAAVSFQRVVQFLDLT